MFKDKILQLIHCFANEREYDKVADQILTHRALHLNRQAYAPSPYFMAKLTARLRAETEPYVMTWEHAIPALRGLILTFSATALLLVATAFTLAINSQQPEENVFAASTNESNLNDTFWTGD